MASHSNPNRAPGTSNRPSGDVKPTYDQVKTYTRECALICNNPKQLIGGGKLDFRDRPRHRTQFFVSAFDDTRPFLGIRVWFPYETDRENSVAVHQPKGGLNDNLHVTIKLYYGTWTTMVTTPTPEDRSAIPARRSKDNGQPKDMVLTITLKDGQKADVENFGMPGLFAKADAEVLFGNARLEGVMSLRDIIAQDKFHLYLVDEKFKELGGSNFAKFFQGKHVDHRLFDYTAW